MSQRVQRFIDSSFIAFQKKQLSQGDLKFLLIMMAKSGDGRAIKQLRDYNEDVEGQKLFLMERQYEQKDTDVKRVTNDLVVGYYGHDDGINWINFIFITMEYLSPTYEWIRTTRHCPLTPGIALFDGEVGELDEDWTNTWKIQALWIKISHGNDVDVDVHPWIIEQEWFDLMESA